MLETKTGEKIMGISKIFNISQV